MILKEFNQFINESINESITFHELIGVKNKWIELTDEMKNKLSSDFFDKISIAYEPIGGHLKIKTPNDIINSDWDVWMAVDHDSDPYSDVVMFGKKTKFGVKWSGVGHDGEKKSKRSYIETRTDLLTNSNTYIEVSKKIAQIFLSHNVPYINDVDTVTKILGKPVKWEGTHPKGTSEDPMEIMDGWYSRKIAGHDETKILLGNPKGINKKFTSTVK